MTYNIDKLPESRCEYTLAEYQEDAMQTWKRDNIRAAVGGRQELVLTYPILKLAGEAGEVAEKFGKMLRDDAGKMSSERHAALVKELGDVLWYIACIAHEMDVGLDFVASVNIEKLRSRNERNRIHGDGDDR